MKNIIITAISMIFIATPSFAADGLIDVPSAHSVEVTATRMEAIFAKKGLTLFNRISHSKNAEKFDINLRNTELLIFGSPKVGAPVMQCAQSASIDLPLKALIWQDEADKVWVSYNDMRYIENRHDILDCEKYIAKMENALGNIVKKATTKDQ